MRNLELPGRSPVHATGGMVATSHPLSSQAATDILKAGGNALDAAIAACAVQCVVEPESTGIGGDCFCLYAPAGSAVPLAYNGSGQAPAAATLEWYQQHGISTLERQSPHAVTVPGAIKAWYELSRDHGALEWPQLLSSAIAYAEHGYPISSRVSVDFAGQIALLRNDANAAAVFMPDGRTPEVGEMHRQPALAATLKKIADGGPDAFYRGEVAEDIVGYLHSLGGLHTMDDFAAVCGEYVAPVSTDFRGYRVYQVPPNGQGIIALQLLNIVAEFEVNKQDPLSAERLHREIEAGRLAYQDRNFYVADPAKAEVPVEWLLSDAHASQLRNTIDPARTLRDLPRFSAPAQQSTVYISVVDGNRNACSFINSLFHSFGSVQMAPQCGVMLHNRGQGFVVESDHPNCIGPGKRPMHTIIPGMVFERDVAVMPYGVMGGHYQSYGHMQFLTRLLDYGMDIQEAQDAPRVFPVPGTRTVEAEGTLPVQTAEALRARGHHLVQPEKPIGGSQAIWINHANGVLTGGSDPRKDGCALGY